MHVYVGAKGGCEGKGEGEGRVRKGGTCLLIWLFKYFSLLSLPPFSFLLVEGEGKGELWHLVMCVSVLSNFSPH